jgi:hypothetical protein
MSEKKCSCERDAPKYYKRTFWGKYKEYCERCWGFVRVVPKEEMKRVDKK